MWIVSPALAAANNGNWHTARRWQAFLSPIASVEISLTWPNRPADALIALHARRSAESIRAFHERYPNRGLGLVLTGTDVYRDIAKDASAANSLELASHLVVLQDEALNELSPAQRQRARVIVQSAASRIVARKTIGTIDIVAVGHLRDEKDPATMMRAVQGLPPDSPIRFIHIGSPLDETLAAQAEQTALLCAQYQWLGGLTHLDTRRWIARARALVHASKMEGGANVVIEAIRSGVPVLASAIPGNIGLLGRDYEGYFPVGDAAALTTLMTKFVNEPPFAQRLTQQCLALTHRYAPAVERAAVRQLLADLLARSSQASLAPNSTAANSK